VAEVKNILFITSSNLATNPRLVKELRLAIAHNYNATVLQFRFNNWSDALTEQLEEEFRDVKFIDISATRRPFRLWLLSTFFEKIFRFVPFFRFNGLLLSFAISKRSFLLWMKLQHLRTKYDWVIAHNPAAFYPAFFFAHRNGARLGIDVEDYHPGETTNIKAAGAMKKLMQLVLPEAAYCSYAAPLIAVEVQKDIPGMNNKQLVVLNGFNAAEFIQPAEQPGEALRLVWFSQHIDGGRGLEKIIPVVNNLYPAVELHLIGSLKADFEQDHLQNKTGIVLHAPMPQKQLHVFLAGFDAGLATDIPVNRNRDIALTNKIIVYAQAGLVIAAMHTLAQDHFLEESDLQYEQMENDPSSIRTAFLNLYQKKERGELNKQEQFQKGQSYAWQKLSQPLLAIWENNYA
jgi:hypothetical protein